MTYKNYKEHYSDCEILANSFLETEKSKQASKLLLENGRLKKVA